MVPTPKPTPQPQHLCDAALIPSSLPSGYEGYDYYSAPSSASGTAASYSYGPTATPSSWDTPKAPELPLSDVGIASYGSDPAPSDNSDSIIAKINQRLDMLSKEGSGGAGEGVEEQER